METGGVFLIVGLGAIALIPIVVIARVFLKFLGHPIGCICVILGLPLLLVGFISSDNGMIAAGVVALALGVALLFCNRKSKGAVIKEIVIEGVEAPKRRRKKNPPEISPKRMFEQCVKILDKKVADRALLMEEISRVMNSAKFSDWSLVQNETYFDVATPRQVGYLQALGYAGKQPRYLGDASFLIECMLVVKSYRERLTSALPPPVSSDVRADYIALWNSATASGVLSKRDATELLKIVMSAPDSSARQALISAISEYLAAPDVAEIPTELFALSEAWLS